MTEEQENEIHLAHLLRMIDDLRDKVESGEIDEVVAAAHSTEGEVRVFVGARDTVGAIGMFAIGQNSLMQRSTGWVM